MSTPREILATAKRNDGGFFKAFEFGNLCISIQASHNHYCSPRIDLEELLNYDSLELAILENINGARVFINPHTDSRFNQTKWVERFETGLTNPVAGFV